MLTSSPKCNKPLLLHANAAIYDFLMILLILSAWGSKAYATIRAVYPIKLSGKVQLGGIAGAKRHYVETVIKRKAAFQELIWRSLAFPRVLV